MLIIWSVEFLVLNVNKFVEREKKKVVTTQRFNFLSRNMWNLFRNILKEITILSIILMTIVASWGLGKDPFCSCPSTSKQYMFIKEVVEYMFCERSKYPLG